MSSDGSGLRTVDRASALLLAFSGGDKTFGVSELARRFDLSKSVTHRTLASLTRSGLLAQETSGKYRLGPAAIQLGTTALTSNDLLTRAMPVLHQVSQETDETATLSVLLNRERMYVAQSEGSQVVRMKVPLGERYPLYAGASGRAILAFLDAGIVTEYLRDTDLTGLTELTITDRETLRARLQSDRRRGYATSCGERDPHAASVAAPIIGLTGTAIGSLSICGPVTRFTRTAFCRFAPTAVAAAASLSGAR